ncbi:hypothetical protein B0H11DRAFT_1697608, partial [Mycena galericulata]
YPVIILYICFVRTIPETPRPNFRAVDWEEFNKAISAYLLANPISTDINSPGDYNTIYYALDKMLQSIIASHVPLLSSWPYSKRWWTKELTELLRIARKAERENWK